MSRRAPADPTSPGPTASRREVLIAGAGMAAASVLGGGSARADPEAPPAAMPHRPLGRTGVSSSVFGLGCFPLGMPEEEAAVHVAVEAIDQGCTYFDTAPSYANGRSEERVGKALRARKDAQVFVATKTHTRTAADARRDLEGSLKRLQVERIDLVQVHAIRDAADLERALAPGGPVEALAKARAEGLIRFVGLTGHEDPEVVKQALASYDFDAVLFPLNCVDPHHRSFETTTLPAAVEKGLARVAMKAFASGNLLARGIDAESCLRYVYALDVATVVVGCRTTEEVAFAARIAREARALTAQERAALLERTQPHRGKAVEWYKRE